MKTSTKFAVVDTALNYFLFTPLVIVFWYGTYALIDALILSRFESRLVGATLTLAVGFCVEFAVTYWQVRACAARETPPTHRCHTYSVPAILSRAIYYYYFFLTPVLNSRGMKKLRYAIQKSTKIKLE